MFLWFDSQLVRRSHLVCLWLARQLAKSDPFAVRVTRPYRAEEFPNQSPHQAARNASDLNPHSPLCLP